jgi:16S rRNA (adenine1518-N6/adenine1519-N6)-dimethyltransferase
VNFHLRNLWRDIFVLTNFMKLTLTEMRSLLAKRDIQLTRSLGQNFLHDGNQLERIVDAAEFDRRTDRVLEIGPGLGPLTELLLEKAGEVLAIEAGRAAGGFFVRTFRHKKTGRIC